MNTPSFRMSLSQRVLQAVRQHGPLAKSEIHRFCTSNLSTHAVSAMLDDLVNAGALVATHGHSAAGRPITTYALAAKHTSPYDYVLDQAWDSSALVSTTDAPKQRAVSA